MRYKPNHKIESFFINHKPLHYKKGELILRAGEQFSGVFYIKKGYVRVYAVSKNGEELTLIIYKPGNIFPITAFLEPPTNNYFIETMTPCELLRASREDLLEFVRNNPDVHLELTRRMVIRFRGMLQRMEHLVFGNAAAKIASILLICVERFGKKEGNKKIIEVPLTHSDIASLVGLTRETASIEVKKLVDEGLIGYKGRQILVKSLGELKKRSFLD